ncbi:MAG: hypothetical protein H6744_03150 [Deltaproteobacteria bacterium]|nr:hypothetical protein [Deltaproteobacteria bacterium]
MTTRPKVTGGLMRLGVALCGAAACLGLVASPAQAVEGLCRDWKRAIDATADGFRGLRVTPKGESSASTFTMYGAEKPCTVSNSKIPGKGRAASRDSLRCELRASEYPIATWERFTGNLETCISVGPLEGWDWQPYLGGSGPAVRVTHPSDPGAVTTTVEKVVRQGITYWAVTVVKDGRVAAERSGYRGSSVPTKTPRGPRTASIRKALLGRAGKGDCLLLLLGRKESDPAVQGLLAGLGEPSKDRAEAGKARVRTWKQHGVTVRTDQAAVVEAVAFAVVPEGQIQAFAGVLPYGIGRADDDFDWTRKMGGAVRAGDGSVYLTDRTVVSPTDTGSGRERRIQTFAVKIRPGWAPYPLTAACGL